MKRLLSMLLAAVLLVTCVPAACAEGDASVFDAMWELSGWSFLVDWGVLTEDEAALLSMDRAAVEAGRELVRTVKVTTGALSGDPHGDQLLADFMSRVTIVNRSQASGEALTLLLDGEEWLSLALSAQEGRYVLDSSLAPSAVSFTTDEVMQPATLVRLTGALQANEVISRDDARMLSVILLGGGVPWPMSMLETDLSGMEGLDLSAWDAAVEGILGRRAYVRIPGGGTNPDAQPKGCDPAAQVWTLEVTSTDMRDLAIAALIVIRDNPVLGDQLAIAVDFDQSANGAGSNVSFNDAFINPLLAELTGAEVEPYFTLCLRGYENGAGALVRLEAEVLDASAADGSSDAEPAVLLRLLYNRLSADGAVTHEVLLGDDRLEIYACCTVTEPYDMYARQYEFTLGGIDPEGVRTEEFRAMLSAVTNRSIPGLTEAQVQLSILNPLYTTQPEDVVYDQYDLQLNLSVCRGGVTEHFPHDRMSVNLNAQHRVGAEVLLDMTCGASYEMDGAELKGTEHYTLTQEGEMLLTCTGEVASRMPEGGICSREAVALSGMSNAELNDWVAQAKANWEALAGGVYDWVMTEAEALPVTGEIVVTDGAAGKTWRIAVVEGEEFVRVEETADDPVAGVNLQHADGSETKIAFTGIAEGSATVRMLTLVGETVVEIDYFEVLVDAQGNVRVPVHRKVKRGDER